MHFVKQGNREELAEIFSKSQSICGLSKPSDKIQKTDSLVFREDHAVAEDETTFRGTSAEGILSYPNASVWGLHLCDPTSQEALLSDVLERFWELDVLEILTALKCTVLNSSQRGRQLDPFH